MTVQSSTNRTDHTGNGSTTVFAYTYLILNATHLVPYLDGVKQTSGFTVDPAGVGNPQGGTVTFTTAPANGVLVSLVREVPYTQEIDYTEYDSFPAETHEAGLDLGVMRDQQIDEQLSRSLHYTFGDTPPDGTELPAPEAFKVIGYDENLNLFNIDVGGGAGNVVRTPMLEDLRTGGYFMRVTSDTAGTLQRGWIGLDGQNRLTLLGSTDNINRDADIRLAGDKVLFEGPSGVGRYYVYAGAESVDLKWLQVQYTGGQVLFNKLNDDATLVTDRARLYAGSSQLEENNVFFDMVDLNRPAGYQRYRFRLQEGVATNDMQLGRWTDSGASFTDWGKFQCGPIIAQANDVSTFASISVISNNSLSSYIDWRLLQAGAANKRWFRAINQNSGLEFQQLTDAAAFSDYAPVVIGGGSTLRSENGQAVMTLRTQSGSTSHVPYFDFRHPNYGDPDRKWSRFQYSQNDFTLRRLSDAGVAVGWSRLGTGNHWIRRDGSGGASPLFWMWDEHATTPAGMGFRMNGTNLDIAPALDVGGNISNDATRIRMDVDATAGSAGVLIYAPNTQGGAAAQGLGSLNAYGGVYDTNQRVYSPVNAPPAAAATQLEVTSGTHSGTVHQIDFDFDSKVETQDTQHDPVTDVINFAEPGLYEIEAQVAVQYNSLASPLKVFWQLIGPSTITIGVDVLPAGTIGAPKIHAIVDIDATEDDTDWTLRLQGGSGNVTFTDIDPSGKVLIRYLGAKQ